MIMSRRRRIGDLGEEWTKSLLERAGFRAIRDLNLVRYNHRGGDFIAEREGEKYFITVKARNKYKQGTRKLNGGYNIYPEKVRRAALEYDATPAWVTIQLDTDEQTYSAYFGTVSSLRNPNAVAVPMLPHNIGAHECLADKVFDETITADLSNQLEIIPDKSTKHGAAPMRRFRQKPTVSSSPPKPQASAKGLIAVPSFEVHVAFAEPAIRPILHELRKRIPALGPAIKETVTRHQRITYGLRHAFVEIKVQKKKILVRVFGTGLPDPRGVVTPIEKSNNWSHDEELAINTLELVDYAMPFVAASYRRELSR